MRPRFFTVRSIWLNVDFTGVISTGFFSDGAAQGFYYWRGPVFLLMVRPSFFTDGAAQVFFTDGAAQFFFTDGAAQGCSFFILMTQPRFFFTDGTAQGFFFFY